jgi:hypothetical protein
VLDAIQAQITETQQLFDVLQNKHDEAIAGVVEPEVEV